MGLLRKAVGIADNVGPVDESGWLDQEDLDFASVTDISDGFSLLAEIESYTSDIEFPIRMFNAIRRFFTFSKAALCVFDEGENAFLSWASFGYDHTTSRRLRVPKIFIERYFSESSEIPCFFTGDILSELKTFFSIRDFASMDKILFNPFFFGNNVVAVYIASFDAEAQIPESDIRIIFEEITEKCAQKLHNSREHALKTIINVPVQSDFSGLLDTLAGEALSNNKKLSVIHFDFTEALDRLLVEAENADPLRLKQEISRIIASMMPGNASFAKNETDKLVVMLLGRSRYDREIVNIQFTQALSNFFHCPLPPIVNAVYCFPDDVEDLGKFRSLNNQ